jgi:hypothetical protein
MDIQLTAGSTIIVLQPNLIASLACRLNTRGQFRPLSYTILSTWEKSSNISPRKRRGDTTRVANLTSYSISHVSRVLRGERHNDRIINSAYNLTRDRKV